MEHRNLKYNRHGTIDCEINHPRYGWIPFTASVADPDPSTAAIYAAIMEGGKPIAAYVEPPAPPEETPDRVTSRQFKMQLEKDGLLDSVEAWIAQQAKLVRIAYENSGSFVRTEPMMQSGFTALGFQSAQIDAFFKAAAKI